MRRLTKAESLRVLRGARDLLARRGGWSHGTTIEERSSGITAYCVTEAVGVAARAEGISVGEWSIEPAIATGLTAYWKREYGYLDAYDAEIQDWNDRSRRRKKDVLELVDGRIAELEEGK